jgi:ACR3 family arsenite efflux pump ArsB
MKLRTSLAFVTKNLSLALPLAMIAGFAFGNWVDAGFLKVAVLPLTFALVYPMMVGIEIKKLFNKGNGKLQATALFLNFAVFPFIAAGLGRLVFPGSPYLQLGLLMAALLPTSGMTVTWTGLSKGNVPEAVRMTIVGLLVGSAATPLYVSFLLGASIDLPIAAIAGQILVIVVLPLVAGRLTGGLLTKKLGKEGFDKAVKPLLPGISSLGVILLVFVAIVLKARSILSNPSLIITTLWPVVVLYAINFVISTLAGRFLFASAEAKALVYGTVMRNLSIALAIVMSLLGPKGGEAALVLTWAYVVQVQSAAWYVRISPRFFRDRDPVVPPV